MNVSGNATLGYASSANYNTITVTGSGSSFITGSTLDVGRQGNYNTLTVANGASAGGYLFYLSGGQGNPSGASNNTVTVTGSSSTLTVSSSWDIADRGAGNQFNILAGGTASMGNGGGYVGYYAGSVSAITVDGSGSTWNTGNIDFGTGTSNQAATVSNGGTWNAAGTITVKNANAINLNSSGVFNVNSVNLSTASSRLNLNGGTLMARQAGNLVTGSGQVNLLGSATVFTNYTTATINRVIYGSGSLTKSGSGTLALTAANTYSGGTTISAGTLQIGSGSTAGSIVGDVVDNANLTFNRSDNIIFGGNISGSGSVTKLGAGTLTLIGTNTFTGGTIILGGSAFSLPLAPGVLFWDPDGNAANNSLATGAGLGGTQFSGDGVMTISTNDDTESVHGAALDADGGLVVVGTVNNIHMFLTRVDSTGNLDSTSFGTSGWVIDTNLSFGGDVVVLPEDGKLLVVDSCWNNLGTGWSYWATFVCYSSTGALDTSYGHTGINGGDNASDGSTYTDAVSADQTIGSLTRQADGKLVLASWHNGGSPIFQISRHMPDGTYDTSFSGDGKLTVAGDWTAAAHINAATVVDGRIVAVGWKGNGTAGNDFAVAVVEGGDRLEQRLWVTHDANWNITAVTDVMGDPVQRSEYDPYGAVTFLTYDWQLTTNNYQLLQGFQGLRIDSITGWWDARNRWLIPSLQTWNRFDPTGYPDGMNGYSFVNANPVNTLDPAGQAAVQTPPASPPALKLPSDYPKPLDPIYGKKVWTLLPRIRGATQTLSAESEQGKTKYFTYNLFHVQFKTEERAENRGMWMAEFPWKLQLTVTDRSKDCTYKFLQYCDYIIMADGAVDKQGSGLDNVPKGKPGEGQGNLPNETPKTWRTPQKVNQAQKEYEFHDTPQALYMERSSNGSTRLSFKIEAWQFCGKEGNLLETMEFEFGYSWGRRDNKEGPIYWEAYWHGIGMDVKKK